MDPKSSSDRQTDLGARSGSFRASDYDDDLAGAQRSADVGAGPQRGFRAPPVGESVDGRPVRTALEPAGDARPAGSSGPPARRRNTLRGNNGRRWAAAIGGVLVVAVVAIAVLAFRLGSRSTPVADRARVTAATTTTPTTLPVTAVYQRVVQSVVLIETSKGSLGSGVVVTDTGTVLTANHVISDGGTVTLLFSDGTRTAATVASADKATDIAKLTPQTLPGVVVPATLGGGITVGSDVVAIGNPLGLRDSTTSGIVSGLGRTTNTKAGGRLSGLIQFDAAVNPGSSGGPLLNAQGLLVGVVVSIADPGDDDAFAGIGFAVPIAGALGGGSGQGPGGGPQI